MNPQSKARKLLPKLTLVLFGILVGALFTEVGLRLAGYSFPDFYHLDYSRGYSLRPGAEGWYSKEGGSYVRINSAGLRDEEHAKEKPANTFRIAVLGDSYPEALPVAMEDAFWAVMEKRLAGCSALAGKQVEVINFGVSGYGTALELITLREHVWQYSPNLVLLAVTTNNDVSDNFFPLRQRVETPYFLYRDGRLLLDESFKNSRSFKVKESRVGRLADLADNHSRLIQVIAEGYRAARISLESWRRKHGSQDNGPNQSAREIRLEELGTDTMIYREARDAVWIEAWRVTEGLLSVIRDEVNSHGAGFVVVTLSNPPQVVPYSKTRQEFAQRLGVKDLFYPDNRLRSYCQQERIPVITLAPQLEAYAEKHNVFLHGFGSQIGNGHWNEAGHRVAGEIIARELCERILSNSAAAGGSAIDIVAR
jgi:hypothetical protein